jgi:hypothetical protein
VWERKKETLDQFFSGNSPQGNAGVSAAACVDMCAPFRLSIQQWAPNCLIVYVLPLLGAGLGDICGGNISFPELPVIY